MSRVREDLFRKLVRELVRQELDEANSTASVGGSYNTPHAFGGSNKKGKGKGKAGYTGGHDDPTDGTGHFIADDPKLRKESVNESGILYKAGVKKYGKEGMSKILSAAGKRKSHAEIGAIKDKYEKESLELDEGGMGILDKDQTDVLHAIVMRNKNKNSKAILSITMKDRMFKGVDKKELLGYIEGAKQFVKYMSIGRTGNESVNEKMGPEQYHRYLQYVFDTQFKTPEEKKMKKNIVRKINVSQKKKGLPVFKESVNEAKSKTIKAIGSIIGKRQAKKIGGVLVDMQTAHVIMKVWNALGSSNRSKFEKLPIKKMADVAWKLVKR